ncbi:LacI family transcriptional regulator [Deinococcus seoulensis]|uniref:LacI family transcriptional regulator n=2 Tax=Deinococcus TaxID=1298 RepID=A0ABQ2RSX2_9DEIO|nr:MULTISPECIES: LacI family DNA-binding transcriptional regulator [Deinococcus]GGR59056.1 LacI family transcriptional regulator [Deinococcus seoulensis]GGS25276.1 LacI family transcriptional regulator [Deinococcus knuensis]
MPAPVTLSEIAARCGVSAMTVSNVLNNRGKVSQATREQVLTVARQMGYVPNVLARGLKSGRTQVLGLVLPALDPVSVEIAQGVQAALSEARYDMLLYTTSADAGRERERVTALSQGLSDGLLIAMPRAAAADVQIFERSRVPVVLINYNGPDTRLPTVLADNFVPARQATEYLLGLGHRRIGFITGDAGSGQSHERLRGYRAALEHAGLAVDEHLVRTGDFTQVRGFAAAAELLALPERPTAIFAANDFSAVGAMEAARHLGLRIPEDVSVVGFDDIPLASQVFPPLTTVRHPFRALGEGAAQLLLSILDGKAVPAGPVNLASELVVRGSTAART